MLQALFRDWMPVDTSSPEASTADLVPMLSLTSTGDSLALSIETKKELFIKMKNFLEEFSNQADHVYPYYRNLSWSVGEEPKLEYTLTLTINRPMTVFSTETVIHVIYLDFYFATAHLTKHCHHK